MLRRQSDCKRQYLTSFILPDVRLRTAKIVKWYKQEGDFVEYKDLLCDIETEVSLLLVALATSVCYVPNVHSPFEAHGYILRISHLELSMRMMLME